MRTTDFSGRSKHNITFKDLSVDGDSPEYQQYVKWCKDHGFRPAPFNVWHRETNSISNYNGMLLGTY